MQSLSINNTGTSHEQNCSSHSNNRRGKVYHPDFVHEKPAYFDLSTVYATRFITLIHTVSSHFSNQAHAAAIGGEIKNLHDKMMAQAL